MTEETKRERDAFNEVLRASAVPIGTLMNSPHGLHPDYAEAFKRADIIYGLDTSRPYGPDSLVVFHGRGALQDAAHNTKPVEISTFTVAYDQRTEQLEALCACCKVHRGACDYARSTGKHLRK